MIGFISQLWHLLDLIHTTALPPNQMIPAGFEPPVSKKNSRPKQTLGFIILINVCPFLLFVPAYL